jgi:hypothetical protein
MLLFRNVSFDAVRSRRCAVPKNRKSCTASMKASALAGGCVILLFVTVIFTTVRSRRWAIRREARGAIQHHRALLLRQVDVLLLFLNVMFWFGEEPPLGSKGKPEERYRNYRALL